jgi:hypothetical protein
MGLPDVDQLFYRYPWIRPLLWLLVAIWTLYFTIPYATSIIWTSFILILGWWWMVAKTLLVLGGQLCVAVPATGVAYLIAVYVIYPIGTITWSCVLDQVALALSSPPPPSFTYTHTHSNGQSYTHTHDAEELKEMQEAFRARAFEEKQQERAEREMRQQNNARGTGKPKRKGKRRK